MTELVCTPCGVVFAATKPAVDYCNCCGEPTCSACAVPHLVACRDSANEAAYHTELEFREAIAEHWREANADAAQDDRRWGGR